MNEEDLQLQAHDVIGTLADRIKQLEIDNALMKSKLATALTLLNAKDEPEEQPT